MELKTTEEFVREAHGAACSGWKSKIEKEFPDLFRKELQVGKWYKGSVDFDSLICITDIKKTRDYNKIYYYGFFNGEYEDGRFMANTDHENSLAEASHAEINAALISEAKRRFGEDWNNVKVKECLYYGKKEWVNSGVFIPLLDSTGNILWSKNGAIFCKGQWAEILHEEKKVITLDKAIKILAKKYNVNPEKIEIK